MSSVSADSDGDQIEVDPAVVVEPAPKKGDYELEYSPFVITILNTVGFGCLGFFLMKMEQRAIWQLMASICVLALGNIPGVGMLIALIWTVMVAMDIYWMACEVADGFKVDEFDSRWGFFKKFPKFEGEFEKSAGIEMQRRDESERAQVPSSRSQKRSRRTREPSKSHGHPYLVHTLLGIFVDLAGVAGVGLAVLCSMVFYVFGPVMAFAITCTIGVVVMIYNFLIGYKAMRGSDVLVRILGGLNAICGFGVLSFEVAVAVVGVFNLLIAILCIVFYSVCFLVFVCAVVVVLVLICLVFIFAIVLVLVVLVILAVAGAFG